MVLVLQANWQDYRQMNYSTRLSSHLHQDRYQYVYSTDKYSSFIHEYGVAETEQTGYII